MDIAPKYTCFIHILRQLIAKLHIFQSFIEIVIFDLIFSLLATITKQIGRVANECKKDKVAV